MQTPGTQARPLAYRRHSMIARGENRSAAPSLYRAPLLYYLILGCRPGSGVSVAGPHPRRLKLQMVIASQVWRRQSALKMPLGWLPLWFRREARLLCSASRRLSSPCIFILCSPCVWVPVSLFEEDTSRMELGASPDDVTAT